LSRGNVEGYWFVGCPMIGEEASLEPRHIMTMLLQSFYFTQSFIACTMVSRLSLF
jgi:hypothetical protein